MKIAWKGTVEIAAPLESTYRYLADLPRHGEWAQSVERMELQDAGDANGVGARYLTYERQALHHDRRPHQSLANRDGIVEKTLAEVRELVPHHRVAWHSHSVPRKNIHADIAFDLAPTAEGGTALTQRITMHFSLPALLLARLLLRVGPAELRSRSETQWQASLQNIKVILEEGEGGPCPVAVAPRVETLG